MNTHVRDNLTAGFPGGSTWQSWTPALTGSSSNPNLGSTGTAAGRYIQIGEFVIATAVFTFGGAGISDGSGNYLVSLPVNADTSVASAICGNGYIFDSGAARYLITAEISTATTGILLFNNTGGAGAVTDAAPVATYAASDRIMITLTYEAA